MLQAFFFFLSLNAATVEIKNMKFNPKIITVKKGESVTWINQDSMLHNVVSEDGKIKSQFLKKGQVFTVKVEKGFKYYCTPHRGMGMVGEVKVKE